MSFINFSGEKWGKLFFFVFPLLSIGALRRLVAQRPPNNWPLAVH